MDETQVASLVPSGQVAWMLAHCGASAIGIAFSSNGVLVNTADWRADRLADAVAA